MPIENTNLFERIRGALNAKNAAEVAEMLGITEQAITRWKKDGGVKIQTLNLVFELSGVSIHWLLTGKGEKFVSEPAEYGLEERRKTINFLASAVESEAIPKISPSSFAAVSIPLIGTISTSQQQIIVLEEQELVKVPQVLMTDDSLLLQIEGHDLESEGLRDGDLLIVQSANGDSDQKIVVAIVPGEKVIIRHYHRTGRIAHFAPIEGNTPEIRFPARDVEIRYIVTSITRRLE